MTNKIKAKNAKKTITFTVNGNVVKTACKTFSTPIKNQDKELVGKCLACMKKSPDVSRACQEKFLIDNPVKIEKKKINSGGYVTHHTFGQPRGSMKNTLNAIFSDGNKTRTEINTYMKSQGYKSFGTDVGLAMNGKKSDARRFPFRVVIEPKTNFLRYDKGQPKGTWNQ